MDAHDDSRGSVGSFKFLANEAKRDVVGIGAAIFRGQGNAQDATLCHFLEHLAIGAVLSVALSYVGEDMLLSELPRHFSDEFLLLAKGEMHGCEFTGSASLMADW